MRVETRIRDRAVVVGASMVGMAVARALSPHFREVLVIDRDTMPTAAPAHRAGVPQSWHIHNLTLRGQRELEGLFPGFVDKAVELGAVRLDHANDVAVLTDMGWAPQFKSDFIGLSATRVLIEFAQRERFRALTPNAHVLEATRVLDLVAEPTGTGFKAQGVITDHPQHPLIRADLVVDCSGRAALWKGWFKQRSIEPPRETVVDSRCGYSSRFYRAHDLGAFSWKALIVDSVYPQQPRWGVIVPLERGEWVVTLGGFNGNHPPSDDQGFLDFAKNLGSPVYCAALEAAEPLTPTRTFRRLEMRWNHFERYRHPISNFLAIGDSCWAYNPLYGQGMSIGATCARMLRDVLAEDSSLESLARRYYARASRFAHPAWTSTALLDMRWPKTEGERPWYGALVLFLGDFVLRAGSYDQAVSRAVLSAVHLLTRPTSLLTPRVIAGVSMYVLRWLVRSLPQLPADRPYSDPR
jgi:2-polyprenyl-6-methoxyphenol hydroxylase-like FAD-dependent oxidoreductase